MHDGEDVDPVRLDAIEKAVGKLRNQCAPQPATERGATGWELEQTLVGLLNGRHEVESEARRLVLVESGGRHELGLCVGMKLNASPKRGADLPEHLFGRNPDDLA